VLLALWLPLEGQISGRVVVGGVGPPQPAYVTVVCEGTGSWTGYSDTHGEFIAFVGAKNLRNGPTNCRVEATISGFTRGIAKVASNQGGVVVTLYPLGRRDDSTVSYQDLAVPPAARREFEKGVEELRERKWKSAEASLRKAIAVYPAYALAWNKLGEALEESRKPGEAGSAYAKAIAIDTRLFSAYAGWAVLDASQERWDRVAATTDAAIKLDPVDWPVLFFYNAVANFNLGRLNEAEQSAKRAIAADQFPRAHYILGHILAARGDYRGAVEHMSKYLDLMTYAADAARVRSEIQDARSRQRLP
jgi:tetratricopeptide (TPR) repeat protein